jgi:predicted RNase H-like nuclease
VLCAYIAALAWLRRAKCLGTNAEGYIVLPRSCGGVKGNGTETS